MPELMPTANRAESASHDAPLHVLGREVIVAATAYLGPVMAVIHYLSDSIHAASSSQRDRSRPMADPRRGA